MTRFDLEQQILSCWHINDDLSVLAKAIVEKDISKTEIINVLNGLNHLYHHRFDEMFSTFEKLINEKRIK